VAKDRNLEQELRPFPYSKAAFEAWLDDAYQGLADDVARYQAEKSWTLRSART
jgi:hypothetical protein